MAEQLHRVFAAADAEMLVDYILRARRSRHRYINPRLFSDPAWDILLILYRGYPQHAEVTVDNLIDTLGLSAAVIGRWIEALELENLVRQKPHPDYAGQTCVELSAHGASAMRRWSANWISEACASGKEQHLTGLLDKLSESNDGQELGR